MSFKDDQKIERFIKKYPTVFKGIGRFNRPFKIHLKENAVPFFQSVPKTVALPLMNKVKNELDRLKAIGVIVPVDFPTD